MEAERWAVVPKGLSDEQRARFSPNCDRVVESGFCRPHMSYIVNPDAVVYTDLKTGISQTFREMVEGATNAPKDALS